MPALVPGPRWGAWLAVCLAAAGPCEVGGALACPGNTTAGDVLAGRSLASKVAIVTGGDRGIGLAAARALAARGARVVIGNRNLTGGEEAARRLREETGADVRAAALDLGSLASVRAFVADVRRSLGPRLDLLVNNAGIVGPSIESGDGYELAFEVDYLGPFLLTELLLPELRATPGARVINVASGAHEIACESAGWHEGCFKDWTYLPPPLVPRRNVTIHTRAGAETMSSSSYGVAKFLNIQHAAALAQREASRGVQAFSLAPGFVLTPMTEKFFDPDAPYVKAVCAQQWQPSPELPVNACPFTPEQGAAMVAHLAVADGLHNGGYYSREWACGMRPIAMHGFTPSMQLDLYDRSLRWSGAAEQPALVVV